MDPVLVCARIGLSGHRLDSFNLYAVQEKASSIRDFCAVSLAFPFFSRAVCGCLRGKTSSHPHTRRDMQNDKLTSHKPDFRAF